MVTMSTESLIKIDRFMNLWIQANIKVCARVCNEITVVVLSPLNNIPVK